MRKSKKILLTITTLVVSTLLFINKVDAIVMWLQCVDKPDDEITTDCCHGFLDTHDTDSFKYYHTFALGNSKDNEDVRYLAYNQNKFYDGYPSPVYLMYKGGLNGKRLLGNICWYDKKVDKFKECDSEDSLVDSSEFGSYCPTAVYQVRGTYGAVKGDFLVLYGKKKVQSSNIEVLNKSIFVVYGYKKKNETKEYIMIEGYDASTGRYGYATNWDGDWKDFKNNLKLNDDDDTNQLISTDGRAKDFMSWTAMTQARRVAKFGRDYYKLLDEKRPWIVGTKDGQDFEITETVNGKNVMFRSDDTNNNFYNFTLKWYQEYSEQLSTQIEAIKKLTEEEKYKKLVRISEEIEKSIDEGKKYAFDDNYTSSQMVLDLNDAFKELKTILEDESINYNYYDENCNLITNGNNSNALGALVTEFNCGLLGVSAASKAEDQTNGTLLDTLIASALSDSLNKFAESDISFDKIQSTAQDYATLFTKAIKYIKKNEQLTGEAETIIVNLNNNYEEMSRKFGTEVIIDCEDLIGKDLREKISSYLNIVKIAIPIILIAFGIIEFSKAIFAGDEDKMKKAQKNFILRIVIAILIFLTPVIVDFLLGIANKVWNFIEPGSCGIFE